MKSAKNTQLGKTTSEILRDLKVANETLRAAHNKNDVINFAIRFFLKLGFDRVRVWLIDQERGLKHGAKCSYMPDRKFQKAAVELRLQDSKILPINYIKIIKRKKPFVNRTFPVLKNFFGEKKLKYSVEFPLFASQHPLGLISVDNAVTGRPLDTKQTDRFMPFVNQIAFALDRVILSEKLAKTNIALKQKVTSATAELKTKNTELEHLAHYDELSQLPNRRCFEKYLSKEFKKASPRCTLTLAMLDIDFLKHVNDTHGHDAGDKLIIQIGAILKKNKAITLAARFAGDEFVFLLVNKSAKKHREILERLLRRIKTATKETVSIGVVTCPDPKIKSEIDLLRIADDALYHAKHTGRDRFVCALGENTDVIPLAQRRKDLQEIEKHGTFAGDYIRQLKAVNKISEHLRTAVKEQTILKKITTTIRRELDFKKVYLYTKKREDEESSDELRLAATSGISKKAEKKIRHGSRVFRKSGSVERAIQSRRVIDLRVRNISPQFVKLFRTKTALVIPLIGRFHTIGAIVAEYDIGRHFRESDHRFFLTLGDQIENGIVKAQAIRNIESFNRKLKREVSAATRKLKEHSRSLGQQVKDNQNLRGKERRTNFELISALATSLEEKDIYTRGHSVRVANYACRLGAALDFTEKQLVNLRYAGLLHDVGKVAIDQSVLNKRTALSEAEMKELAKHPVVGEKIVSSVRFLRDTAHIIRHHHERWDGAGYPDHEKGTRIPVESRILAIADAYDAMITRRSYGKAMKKSAAINELITGGGKQFDPKLVKLFAKLMRKSRSRPKKKS
ncbi:MAG: diguanylate cyclase [Patescibacteria group bacterium]